MENAQKPPAAGFDKPGPPAGLDAARTGPPRGLFDPAIFDPAIFDVGASIVMGKATVPAPAPLGKEGKPPHVSLE